MGRFTLNPFKKPRKSDIPVGGLESCAIPAHGKFCASIAPIG